MPEIFVIDATVEVRIGVEGHDRADAEQKAKHKLSKLLENSVLGGGSEVRINQVKQVK